MGFLALVEVRGVPALGGDRLSALEVDLDKDGVKQTSYAFGVSSGHVVGELVGAASATSLGGGKLAGQLVLGYDVIDLRFWSLAAGAL
eukprot:5403734-Pyramimonas_sp.AAC.1